MGTVSNQFPVRPKPNRGCLLYNGRLILENKPFKFLQHKKKLMLQTGLYRKDLFKITYYYGNR